MDDREAVFDMRIEAFKARQRGIRSPRGSLTGFHFYIDRDGSAHKGRDLEEQCRESGDACEEGIAICLFGGANKTRLKGSIKNFPKAQLRTLWKLIDELLEKYPEAELVCHKDVDPDEKSCPGFTLKQLTLVRAKVMRK